MKRGGMNKGEWILCEQVIVGRLAMLGFFFAVLGEVTYGNGAGPLGQIGIELPHNGPLITYGILIWTALNAAAGYFLGNFGEVSPAPTPSLTSFPRGAPEYFAEMCSLAQNPPYY